MILGDQSKNNVTVCGRVCESSYQDSTKDTYICVIPALRTIYSMNNYKLTANDNSNLMGTLFSNAWSSYNMNVLFDGNYVNGWQSFMASGISYFGMYFPEQHIAVLTEVKYYMSYKI